MDDLTKINQAYQLYNTTCPFELSRNLDIHIHYVDFWKNIYGYYSPMLSTAHILINDNLSLEIQEKICSHLITHHILNGAYRMALCLDQDAFLNLEKKKALSLIPSFKSKIIPFPIK